MKVKKALGLLLSVIFICMTFAPIAMARWEGCSFCGARMVVVDESSPYGYVYKFIPCLQNPSWNDVQQSYKVDFLYQCSSPSCGREYYTETKTFTTRDCPHG